MGEHTGRVDTTKLLGFLGVVALAYAVPGPDLALIVRYGSRSSSLGRAAALGILSGLCVHMLASVLGLSALLQHSAAAFMVVKILGAGYLFLLGLQALLSAIRTNEVPHLVHAAELDNPVEVTERGNHRYRAFRQGFVTNILNPKAILFFVSLLPQFIDPGGPVLGQTVFLGAATVFFGASWWFIMIALIGRVRKLLARRQVRRVLDAFTGVAFVGLGARLLQG